jgi:hypothetical protein
MMHDEQRDDWMSPAAFVGRVDLKAEPNSIPDILIEGKIVCRPEWMVLVPEQYPAGTKIGSQVRIRLPNDFMVVDKPFAIKSADEIIAEAAQSALELTLQDIGRLALGDISFQPNNAYIVSADGPNLSIRDVSDVFYHD